MIIGVYTIAKNEASHVKDWLEACREADFICVADTGSIDDTVSLLKEGGAEVHHFTEPFRFDWARNFVLEKAKRCNPDILLSLDLDEYPAEDWREKLEAAAEGNNGWRITIDNGSYSFRNIRAHRPEGWHWEHACHEVLCGNGPVGDTEVRAVHHKDAAKPRNYLPLLELDAEENPESGRAWHYLGREYMYLGRWKEAVDAFEATIYDGWQEQRAMTHVFASRCKWHLGWMEEAKKDAYCAIKTYGSREAWVHLAWLLNELGDPSAAVAAKAALQVWRKGLYPPEPDAWSEQTENWLRALAEGE